MKKNLFLLCVLAAVVGCGQVTTSQTQQTTNTPSITNSTVTPNTNNPNTSVTGNSSTTSKVTSTQPSNSSTTTSTSGVVGSGKLYDATIENKIPDGYYDNCRGLKGEALKTALHNIIKGHKTYSYSSTTSFYKEIDKDPHDSSKMYFIYTGATSINTAYNKEHVWAKSHGSFDGINPMHADLHNLHPCNSNLNSTRGNLHFGEGGEIISGYNGNNKKTSSTFEPSDFSKGDTARTIFYMAVRYEGTNGEKDLELKAPSSSNYYNFSSGADGTHGNFDDLYKWATSGQDPVDDYEVSRNNVIYEKYQGNRNPFIDHPEFVKMIYDKNYTGPGALLDEDPYKKATAQEEAQAFIDKVNSIDENNINSKSALDQALELYNSMSDEAKELAKDAYKSLLEKIKTNQEVVDNYYINEVINKINEIGEVTLEDKELIEEAESLYNKLSDEAKAKITNYETLLAARAKYDELYNAWLNSNPIEPFEYLFGESSGAKSAYTPDLTITHNNKQFFASYCYKSGSEFRLGHNKSATAPTKFTSAISGIKSNSSSLESLFDITGQKITIETYNQYGTLNNMYLLKSTDNGTTYQLVGTEKAAGNTTIEFNITPGKARYAIVIDGSTPRLALTSLKVS